MYFFLHTPDSIYFRMVVHTYLFFSFKLPGVAESCEPVQRMIREKHLDPQSTWNNGLLGCLWSFWAIVVHTFGVHILVRMRSAKASTGGTPVSKENASRGKRSLWADIALVNLGSVGSDDTPSPVQQGRKPRTPDLTPSPATADQVKRSLGFYSLKHIAVSEKGGGHFCSCCCNEGPTVWGPSCGP